MRVSFLRTDFSGCSHYRLIQIRDEMLNKGLIHCFDNDNGYSPLSDIVIWQRYDDLELLHMMDKTKINVYELDDNYWELPDHLELCKQYYDNKITCVNTFINNCDYLTTTSEYLADVVVENTGFDRNKIKIIPNFINLDRLNLTPKTLNGKIRIAWTLDGRRKDIDIEPVKNVLLELLDTRDDIELLFMGGLPEAFEGKENVIYIKPTSVDTYYKNIMNTRIDIGICPAIDNEFNNCKSALKLLEYSAMGIPSICSDIYPYRHESLRKGQKDPCHFVCNKEEQWKSALINLIENPKLRFLVGMEMHEYVKENYNLSKGVYEYLDFWNSIFDDSPKWEESFNSSCKIVCGVCGKDTSKYEKIKIELTRNSKLYDLELVYGVNDGSKNLGDFYNQVINTKEADYYVFCHNDIYLDDKDWVDKLLKGFEEFDVIGVAGSTVYDTMTGAWTALRSPALCRGCVAHKNPRGFYEMANYGGPGEVSVIDGVFMAIKSSVAKDLKFNSFNKFHFYDIDFCLRAIEKGYKVGVVPMEIRHDSPGSYDSSWLKALKDFRKVYGDKFYRISKEEFPIPVLIDPRLDNTRGLNKMIETLENQSIKVNYKIDYPCKYKEKLFLSDYLVFNHYSFEFINSIVRLDKFGKVRFEVDGVFYEVFLNHEKPIYNMNTVLARDYTKSFINNDFVGLLS